MKKVKSIISFCAFLWLGILSQNATQAQTCNPTFNQGSYVTVAYCSTGTCATTTVSVSWNTTSCSGLGDPTWELTSSGTNASALGLEWGGSATCSTVGSTRTCTRTIRCKNQNFMKGQVRVRWSGLCGVSAEIVRSIDVFKTFTATDLNTQTNVDEPGQTTYYIAGTDCAGANERLAFAVRPYITNPASDMIGQDKYYWTVGGFTPLVPTALGTANPTDYSAIILRAPDPMPAQIQLTVRLGQYNSGTHASMFVNKRPKTPAIKMGNYPTGCWVGVNQGATDNDAQACMNATYTGTFDLTLFDGESDVTYEWSWPGGFTPTTATSGVGVTTVTFQANTGSPAVVGAGRFTCQAKGGGTCGNRAGTLDVIRLLNSGYSITQTPASSPAQCLSPGVEYTFSLTGTTNVPTNQAYEWSYPAGWTVTGGATGSSIKLTPPVNGNGGTVSVKPNTTGQNSACTTGTFVSTGTYSVRGEGGYPVSALRDATSRTFYAQVATGGTTLNYPSCDDSQFDYAWSYRGRFTTSGGTSTNYPTSLGSPCTDSWYNAPGSTPGATDPFAGANGNQTITLKAGTHAAHPSCSTDGGARLRVIVSSKPGSTCGVNGGGCYYSIGIMSVPGTLSRPGHGGGDNPTQLTIGELEHTLELIPNPSSGKTTIRIGQLSDTPLRIRDMQGRVVHQVLSPGKEQTVDLQKLPRGMYQVEYFDGTEMLTGLLRLE